MTEDGGAASGDRLAEFGCPSRIGLLSAHSKQPHQLLPGKPCQRVANRDTGGVDSPQNVGPVWPVFQDRGSSVLVSQLDVQMYRERAAQCLALAGRSQRDDDVALHFRHASAWGEPDFGSELSSIEESIHNIAMGKCLNARLCGQ